VAVLGSTGSVGTAALRVIQRHSDMFRVAALTAFRNAETLRQQAAAACPGYVGLVDERGECDQAWGRGVNCLVEAATRDEVDIVLNADVGAAGLDETQAALRAGKRVALANKESLVTAGDLVLEACAEGGGELVPVDSEHSAILQCIGARPATEIRRVILTASGGPFRGWSSERIAQATLDDALCHPTWRMGPKITVDSATLANKALEVIEAHYLFRLPYDRIDVVVHPQSIVHSFVEFVDGSVVAQLGVPNMELPILYALTYPDRITDAEIPAFDPAGSSPFTFEPVATDAFPAFALGVEAGRRGGTAPAVFNSANEAAVALFLAGRIGFPDIARGIAAALEAPGGVSARSIGDILEAGARARRTVEELFQC
jgi:1-deoxy-D-xylulose-5-phosphate reductoisomerase